MKRRNRLNILLTLFVLTIIFSANAIITLAVILLYVSGTITKLHLAPLSVVILSLISSILISAALSGLFIKYFFRPLNALIAATKQVAAGDFSVRIEEYGGGHPRRILAKSEIGTLVRSFNEMVEELASVELFRHDFISNFSHEFKTPILSIRGFARQLVKGGLTPQQQTEFCRIIADESEYLAHMSSNVLLLTKLENQQIVTDRRPFRLDEQLRDCMLLFESQWSEKDLNVEMELEPVEYTQNPELLSHVWNNLISNAVKFTPPGGCIAVTLRADAGWVSVTVRDSGPGISEETQRHMFEKFYQGDSSHQCAGNGLGLALVRRIADMTGAVLRCESEVGRGTAFTVSLPKQVPKFAARAATGDKYGTQKQAQELPPVRNDGL